MLDDEKKRRANATKKCIEKKKSLHLCIICGKPAIDGITMCEKCRDKKRKANKENYNYYIENRICPMCKMNSLYGDERACPECLAKAAGRHKKYMEKIDIEKYRKYEREYFRKRRQEQKKNGICIMCGKRKIDNGYKSCGICRQKNRERQILRRKNKGIMSMYEKKIAKICVFCGGELKPGYQVCENCYKRIDNVKNHENTIACRKRYKREHWRD